jgi:protein TonB
VGYVTVLAIMFVAFEWTEYDIKVDTSDVISDVIFEEEIVPITQADQSIAPPPSEVPNEIEVLNIVDDNASVATTTLASSEDTGGKVEVKYIASTSIVEEEPEEQVIFEVVENMPEFPGGMSELMQYFSKNIKYPAIAQENGTQGRVIVQFVVNRDGSIVDPVVVRSVDPYLDKEALRVIMAMPKWKPGMQRGKSVRVKFTVPVQFRLQ